VSVDHHGALPASYRLQEYRIERVLGFGGFGITYLATDTNLHKLVAIKEYLPAALAMRTANSAVVPTAGEYADDFRWGLDRFVDEARALARFRHANLVPVHRFFEANGTAYVVMDYERGERLSDLLRRLPAGMPQAQTLHLLKGLLDGLETVHRGGYLHRDIKPSNVIVRSDGTPVLLDFGAARQALGRRSQSVTAIVTPGYAPLEQYASGGNQGPWTDLYAVGALAHQLVTGKTPPEATSRVRNDPYRPLVLQTVSGYDGAVLQAIDWALRIDEHERPQSVREFRDALQGRDIAAMPAIISAAMIAPRRRARSLFIAAGIFLVLLLLGGAYYWHERQLEQERQQAAELQRQQEETRNRQAEEQARAEEARLAQQRVAAEKAALEKAAADKVAAEKAAADKAAAEKLEAEKAAAEKVAAAKAAVATKAAADQAASAMTSQRAAEQARDAATKARQMVIQARRNAELGRQKAAQARETAVAARRASAAAAPDQTESKSGVVYRGERKGDVRHGLGVLNVSPGYRYEGQWRDDIATGFGVSEEGGVGERYEGEYAGGKRRGHGTLHWGDGLRYEGEFDRNSRTGHGVTYDGSGASIEAKWIDGLPDTFAVVQDGKGMRYEGTVIGGKFHGVGVLTFASGERFEGQLSDDKRSGYGIFYLPNGTSRSGLWRDDRLVKPD
jgi:hypothetical protein